MKQKSLLLISAISFLIFACSSSMPGWASKVPAKKGYMYTVGSGLEDDMQQAIIEAEALARSQLAQNLQVEVAGMVSRVNESVKNRSTQANFKTGIDLAYSTDLSGTRTAKQEVSKEKGLFRAYVLMEYDLGAASDRLLAKIKSDEELYDAMRTTELYKEMEDKVEAYRKRQSK